MARNGGKVRKAPVSRRGDIRLSPPATLAALYLVLILLGTVLLKTPIATQVDVSWSDAAFTAVSAVTVTGLVVVDTGTVYTHFGQAVILLLIQLGGLGLMTFALMVLSVLGIPMGLPQQMYLKEDLNQTSIGGVTRLGLTILKVVVLCELAGMAFLAFVFVPEFGWGEGLWQALFHSISAFNNAGFGLHADSLTRWVSDPIVNVTVPLLVIIGGIGFSVLSDIWQHRAWRKLTMHSKLMLSGTAALLVLSTFGFAALEWTNPATLGGLESDGDRVIASWFQAVMTRTAGFNSVDIAGLHDSTSFMVMCLMVIGGGSTSTAGGMKVVTFVVLILATYAFFRRKRNVEAFGRSIGVEELLKVLAVTVTMLFLVITALFAITITNDVDFVDLAFETTSAMGTVGLSRGTTGELDTFGRVVIMIVMFLGRVGPLTLGFFLATRTPPRTSYPPGRILIG